MGGGSIQDQHPEAEANSNEILKDNDTPNRWILTIYY